ncbi:MAG: RNA-directed DNA polymerase, partial [Candidatus Saccharimonadales bacterium]
EEQGGFRAGRGCVDQLFILTEVINSRREKGKHTYVAFLDFSKAYDVVWRAGMLHRLNKVGIRGRAWRVVRDMYRKVRSCVSLKGVHSEWWEFEQGVRQGSVLSPLLFSVTIIHLVQFMRERGHGITIGDATVSCLLFADDLVLMAEDEAGMRRVLADVDEWARQWRFVFNVDKCGVMVVGERKLKQRKGNPSGKGKESKMKKREKWSIAAGEIKEVDSYKYLGMEREKKRGWAKYVERVVSKGRSRLYQLMMVGAHQHGLRPSTGKKLAETIVRPVLEYGAEVLAPTQKQAADIERVMVSAGKLITGLPRAALCDAVRGELGWCTMAERREVAKLKYFQRLRTLPSGRLVRKVFERRMEEAKQQRIAKALGLKRHAKKGIGFCNDVFDIMSKYGMLDQWKIITNTDDADNVAVCEWWEGTEEKPGRKEAVEREQHKAWRQRLMSTSKGPFYLKCKKDWGMDPCLHQQGSKSGRVWKTSSALIVRARLPNAEARNDRTWVSHAGFDSSSAGHWSGSSRQPAFTVATCSGFIESPTPSANAFLSRSYSLQVASMCVWSSASPDLHTRHTLVGERCSLFSSACSGTALALILVFHTLPLLLPC